MKKILITGKDGQVGYEMQRALASVGTIIACDKQTADLSNPLALRQLIRDIKPDIIVNAAAYTAVDKAETEVELAMDINGKAPGVLAEEAKRLNATLVHYSTDYVFDGTSDRPYTENSIPNPLNQYGKSKLAGEQAIQSIGGSYLILRTSWVYSTRGKNFLLTMLKLAKERDQLKIVVDQIGAPTWSKQIADYSTLMLSHCLANSDISGIYHLSASGTTSWCGFAKEIIHHAARLKMIEKVPLITGIPSSEYPLPAKRPHNSILSNDKMKALLKRPMLSWDKALELLMNFELPFLG